MSTARGQGGAETVPACTRTGNDKGWECLTSFTEEDWDLSEIVLFQLADAKEF